MQSRETNVTIRLRELILNGRFSVGEPLRETRLAEMLGVSRTPVRLALGALEHEGLVSRVPHRGFTVQGFQRGSISDAIEVRSTLEGMAARLVAERGLDQETEQTLKTCLEVGESLLAKANLEEGDAAEYERMNVAFHRGIAAASGNRTLVKHLQLIDKVPFAAAGAVAFKHEGLMRPQFALGHQQHTAILDALRRGEGTRAEFLMREHALISKESLDLIDLEQETPQRQVPGLRLIADAG